MRLVPSRLTGALALALVLVWGPAAQADLLTLGSANSSVTLDAHTQAGMYDWVIDGVTHMPGTIPTGGGGQWFWYRVGATPEASINTLTPTGHSLLSPDIARISYADAGGLFTVEITYLLTGGTPGSGTADVAESIKVVNTSGSTLDFHFFQYNDYALGGTFDDTARIDSLTLAVQTDPAGFGMSETIQSSNASSTRYEVAIYPLLLAALNDGAATTLSNFAGPAGPDATFAWQWDKVLTTSGANKTLLISKDKLISVAEPASLLFLGAGLVGLAWYSRRHFSPRA